MWYICYIFFCRNGPQDYEPYGLSPHYWHVFAARLAFVVVFEVSFYSKLFKKVLIHFFNFVFNNFPQHVVFVITGIMQFIIPDIPAEVKTQMQREQLLAKEAKYQHGMKRAQGESQDLISLFREASSRQSTQSNMPFAGTDGAPFASRRSWARRFSRLSDGLDAHVEVAARPRRSMESTVWEVSWHEEEAESEDVTNAKQSNAKWNLQSI